MTYFVFIHFSCKINQCWCLSIAYFQLKFGKFWQYPIRQFLPIIDTMFCYSLHNISTQCYRIKLIMSERIDKVATRVKQTPFKRFFFIKVLMFFIVIVGLCH